MKKLVYCFFGEQEKIKNIYIAVVAFAKHPFVRKNKQILHTVEWVILLLAFFAVGFPVLYFQSSETLLGDGKLKVNGVARVQGSSDEEFLSFIGQTSPDSIDTDNWSIYRNQWYGFEIEHPDEWVGLRYKTPNTKNARYEAIYEFRKSNEDNDAYIGFDVSVYSTKKAGAPEISNDIHWLENSSGDIGSCNFSSEMTLGEINDKFQKISVEKGNLCFEPAYFFSIKKGEFMYDIVPVAKEGVQQSDDPESDVTQNFPEYKDIVTSFKSIPVSRPKPVVSKPRISARRPVSAKMVGGKLVCAKKNDHPGKSQNGNKPGHMDMECCLDPDETPNPWCTYSSQKYQKYLK
jgi:hypothetical protein